MTPLDTLQSLICSTPVHLVFFFTLLGTELYQSIITAKKYLHALRRDQPPPLQLQERVSPVLRAQSILLLLVATTVPSRGFPSLIEHKSSWVPLLIGSYATALNLFLFGPRASRALNDLKLQSVIDSSAKASEAEPLNPNVAGLEKSFRRNRAATMHLNIVTIVATICYGWGLMKTINA